MKKLISYFICLVLLWSCSFEIPKQININLDSDWYIPLGSPFTDGDSLKDHIGPDKIREMMTDAVSAAGSHNIKIYEYRGPDVAADVLTYLVHYPIVEMQLDLQEYVDEVLEADDVRSTFQIPDDIALLSEGTFPAGGFYLDEEGNHHDDDTGISPLFRVPLADMAKLVKEINGKPGGEGFGLSVSCESNFGDNIQVCIPALDLGAITAGVKTYEPGVWDGNKLVFVNPLKTQISPEDDLENGDLEIYVWIKGPCSGEITIELIFDWDNAVIDTSDFDSPDLSGTYKISNSLGDFLGTDVEFSNVKGYIYVDGIDGAETSARISLSADGIGTILSDEGLTNRDRPTFTDPEIYYGSIPEHSLTQEFVDLASILNNSSGSNTTDLSYEINIEEWTIYRDSIDSGSTITADLLVLLPLELRISTPAAGYSNYVKLDLGDIFGKLDDDGDLFGRTGDGDSFFKYLDEVTIFVKSIKSTAIERDRLAVHVYTTALDKNGIPRIPYNGFLDLGVPEPSITIGGDDLSSLPFNPKFEALLKKDEGESYGTFRILRQAPGEEAELDFNLAVRAKILVEDTMDL